MRGRRMRLRICIIGVIMIFMVQGALYEEGTYFKPVDSDIGYILGQNLTMDLILVKDENITFNYGSTFITFYGSSAAAGNITLYEVTDGFVNHTNDLNADTTIIVNGLDWSLGYINVSTGTPPTPYIQDDDPPLNFTIANSVVYTEYFGVDAEGATTTSSTVTTSTIPGTTTTLQAVAVATVSGERSCFSHFTDGDILKTILCPYEVGFGGERTAEQPSNWFYVIILLTITVPLAIGVGNISVGVLLMDLFILIFGYYNLLPPRFYPFAAILNIIVIASGYFHKPFAPKLQN